MLRTGLVECLSELASRLPLTDASRDPPLDLTGFSGDAESD